MDLPANGLPRVVAVRIVNFRFGSVPMAVCFREVELCTAHSGAMVPRLLPLS